MITATAAPQVEVIGGDVVDDVESTATADEGSRRCRWEWVGEGAGLLNPCRRAVVVVAHACVRSES